VKNAHSQPEELLSLQSLARHLDIPYVRAIEFRAKGHLTHDFFTKHFLLFRKSRLPELAKALKPASRSVR
jgi:hypothetical protein